MPLGFGLIGIQHTMIDEKRYIERSWNQTFTHRLYATDIPVHQGFVSSECSGKNSIELIFKKTFMKRFT